MTPALQQLTSEVEDLAEKIRKDLAPHTPDTAPKVVILFMLAKAHKSFRAAVLLYNQCYWQDAVSLARTILEVMFHALRLEQDLDARAILFLKGAERERRKLLDNLSRHGAKEIHGKVDQLLRDLSRTEDIDLAWRNWWTKSGNIEQLSRKLGRPVELTYQIKYRPMSWFIHSSPFSMKYFTPRVPEEFAPEEILAEPELSDEKFIEMLFSAAHEGLFNILAITDSIYALGRQSDFDPVKATLMRFARSE
jgi:hypothetical protein